MYTFNQLHSNYTLSNDFGKTSRWNSSERHPRCERVSHGPKWTLTPGADVCGLSAKENTWAVRGAEQHCSLHNTLHCLLKLTLPHASSKLENTQDVARHEAAQSTRVTWRRSAAGSCCLQVRNWRQNHRTHNDRHATRLRYWHQGGNRRVSPKRQSQWKHISDFQSLPLPVWLWVVTRHLSRAGSLKQRIPNTWILLRLTAARTLWVSAESHPLSTHTHAENNKRPISRMHSVLQLPQSDGTNTNKVTPDVSCAANKTGGSLRQNPRSWSKCSETDILTRCRPLCQKEASRLENEGQPATKDSES